VHGLTVHQQDFLIKDIMFRVLDEKHHDFNVIEITEGQFKDFKIVYGEIKFADAPNEDGTYTIKFDCDVMNDKMVTDRDAFQEVTGDILVALMDTAVKESEYLLKGGIDEAN